MAANRTDVQIPSHNELLAAWLYRGNGTTATPGPCIILAHGVGAVKDMRLAAFAEPFFAAGYTCLVFDYRCLGGSTGKPRSLVNWNMQQEDWDSAISYAKSLEGVDPQRIGIFGTSFTGGHVIQVAARHPELKAVISQCPFTDGIRTTLCVGFTVIPKLVFLGIRDVLFGTDDQPVRVKLVGKPGETAMMNRPDSMSGYTALIPPGVQGFLDAIPARLALTLALLRPGAYAKSVSSPILFAICGKDSICPAEASRSYAKKAKKPTIKWYDEMGHFDVYYGEALEKVLKDYLEFLKINLPV